MNPTKANMTDKSVSEETRELVDLCGDCPRCGSVSITTRDALLSRIAELEADKRRLDWLQESEGQARENSGEWQVKVGHDMNGPVWVWGGSVREALDAALTTQEDK